MRNGRCYRHGGPSTGPRTPEGLQRIVKARTVHGAYGAEMRELRAATPARAARKEASNRKPPQKPLQFRLPREEVKAIKMAAADREQTVSDFMLSCLHEIVPVISTTRSRIRDPSKGWLRGWSAAVAKWPDMM